MANFDLNALRDQLRGTVLGPGDKGFAAAHMGFNIAHEHRPDAVVCAANAEDVAAAVRYGVDTGVPLRVQATGHGIGAPMDGGILISTAQMHSVSVDPQCRTATVGAGTRWHQVIDAAAPFGLTGLCGSSVTVGVVGYTLGGGMGPMARTFGFNSDQVRRFQLVDATGRILDVDPLSQPDLFWALRGGKPALGIVTEMEFGLVDVPTYYGGAIFYPGDSARDVLHAFAAWAPTLPNSASASIALLRLPDEPEVPQPLRGVLSVHLRYVHVGNEAQGTALVAPMRAAAPAIADLVGVSPSTAIAAVHQDPPGPLPGRDAGMLLREFPAEAVEALLATAGPESNAPLIVAEVRAMGGALDTPGEHDSAVAGRAGRFSVCVIGPYPPPLRDAVDAACASVLAAMQPWAADGALINFHGNGADSDTVRGSWTPSTRARLDAIEAQWDPSRVFSFAFTNAVRPVARV